MAFWRRNPRLGGVINANKGDEWFHPVAALADEHFEKNAREMTVRATAKGPLRVRL